MPTLTTRFGACESEGCALGDCPSCLEITRLRHALADEQLAHAATRRDPVSALARLTFTITPAGRRALAAAAGEG